MIALGEVIPASPQVFLSKSFQRLPQRRGQAQGVVDHYLVSWNYWIADVVCDEREVKVQDRPQHDLLLLGPLCFPKLHTFGAAAPGGYLRRFAMCYIHYPDKYAPLMGPFDRPSTRPSSVLVAPPADDPFDGIQPYCGHTSNISYWA